MAFSYYDDEEYHVTIIQLFFCEFLKFIVNFERRDFDEIRPPSRANILTKFSHAVGLTGLDFRTRTRSSMENFAYGRLLKGAFRCD